jgi:hypothetical protein
VLVMPYASRAPARPFWFGRLVLVVFLTLVAAVIALLSMAWAGACGSGPTDPCGWTLLILLMGGIPLVGVSFLAWALVVAFRVGGNRPGVATPKPGDGAAEPTHPTLGVQARNLWSGLPYRSIGLVAVVLATGAFLFVSTESLSMRLIGLFVLFVPIVLPTALVYFLVLCALALFIRAPNLMTGAMLALSLGPLGYWGYEQARAAALRDEDVAALSAIPRHHVTAYPTVAVVRGDENFVSLMRRDYGFDRVIFDAGRGRLESFSGIDRHTEGVAVKALPENYILLNVGEASSFRDQVNGNAHHSGPYEIRLVTATNDLLVDIWWADNIRRPVWIPVFGLSGLLTDNRGENPYDRMRMLIAAALEGAVPDASLNGHP